MVEVSIRWSSKFKRSHADIVKSLVIDTESLIRVFNKLMDRQSSIVRLNDSVGNLRGRDDGESSHHSVGELLTDLGNQESTHTSTRATTEGVGDLETLEAVTSLSLTSDDIKDLINELSTLSVVTLSPIVTSAGLTENEVVWAEKLTKRARTDSIHGTRLKVNKDSSGDIFIPSGFIEVYVHPL